jgi:hypothetical protein
VSNEPGPCPCCGQPINDYRESLGSFTCKSCGFMMMGSQVNHLGILQHQRREAEAGHILRRSLGAAGVGPSTAASVRRMLAAYDDMVQGVRDE